MDSVIGKVGCKVLLTSILEKLDVDVSTQTITFYIEGKTGLAKTMYKLTA